MPTRICPICGIERPAQGFNFHVLNHKRSKALASEGRCPDCGTVIWSGGAPGPSEFPLTCNGVGCTRVVKAEEAV